MARARVATFPPSLLHPLPMPVCRPPSSQSPAPDLTSCWEEREKTRVRVREILKQRKREEGEERLRGD